MILNGSQIIAEVLIENGVDAVFGYPGGAVLNIYDALYEYRDKITHYMTAHEQGAAHAADGYARATGKTGVVFATSGPGATNLVTGIATAYMDSVPLVAITGNVTLNQIGRDSFQEIYITGVTTPITKHNYIVRDVTKLADTLRSAFKIASSGRPGPVLVDIPKDITAAKCEFEHPKPKDREEKTEAKKYDLSEIAEIINNAEKPAVIIGGGVKISKAENELKEFIKKSGIPTCHTIMASGILRYDDPLNIGILGMHGTICANRTINDADVVIALGTRFSDRVALIPDKFAKRAQIIQIDIDKSEINKNVAVDKSIIGDVKEVLSQLTPLVESVDRSKWLDWVNKQKKEIGDSDPEKLTPKNVVKAINEAAGENGIFVTDVGQHQMWAAQYLNHVCADNFLTSGGLGTMGYGYGAAIGAQIGTRKSHVFHITGDGSFHMNMNEACTAVTYNVPVISIIFNNSALGMVRQWQTLLYGKRYSSSEPDRKTNYVKVAEGFGAKGYHCETLAELKTALSEAVKYNGPVWIECIIDREEKVLPMIPAGKSIENVITE